MSAAHFDQGIDDPFDFKTAQLSTLDELLRCPICKEIYNDALIITTCLHSFCALCIRRGLSNEQICPTCRKPAYESNLKHNADIDSIANSWRESRQFLISIDRMATAPEQNSTIMHCDYDPIDDFASTDDFRPSTSTSTIPTASSSRRSSRLSLQTVSTASSLQDPICANQSNISAMDTFQSSQLPISPSPKSNANTTTKLTSTSIVECPICCKKMRYSVLDVHIDKCSPTESYPAASRSESSLFPFNSSSFSVPMTKAPKSLKSSTVDLGKKPIKQVYAIMKDRELVELLRAFNLPEHGSRAQRIWRHKEYVNLYNANSDSRHPVSAKVLVQRLQATENAQNVEKHNQSKRKATDSEEHKATYADQYTSLINDIKRKKASSNTGTHPDQ
ncbi:hypothetical protein BD408DRAFT_423980 [Parasitella parasitica]|nr:hypothetical protein BD408DRAFT_423980 [Parasitella parasitica]